MDQPNKLLVIGFSSFSLIQGFTAVQGSMIILSIIRFVEIGVGVGTGVGFDVIL
jgi:hypothetical protein